MPKRFLSSDRRKWLADGSTPDTRQTGSVLFLDIAGFTPLTNKLARAVGRDAAEELGDLLNAVFNPLIEAIDERGGAVVNFAGDALSCWFDGDDGFRAGCAALRCQQLMAASELVSSSAGETRLECKISVAHGTASRASVGNPDNQLVEAFFGDAVERAAYGDQAAVPGDVVADDAVVRALGDLAIVVEVRDARGNEYSVLEPSGRELPEPGVSDRLPDVPVAAEDLALWIPLRLRQLLSLGAEAELSENRPAISVFISFSGIDTSAPEAVDHLDGYLRHVQSVVSAHGGTVLGLDLGDKGAVLLVVFGAPEAHSDDPTRALAAAESLRTPPEGSAVTEVRIAMAAGIVWAGVMGGRSRQTYTVLGDSVNVAARLMGLSDDGEVLLVGDFTTAEDRFEMWPMPAKVIKGHPGVIASELVGPTDESGSRLQPKRRPFPMVGRHEELDAAKDFVAAGLEGRGGVIHVTGGVGQGKSRFVDELLTHGLSLGFRSAGSEAHGYGEATPYLVLRRIFRMLLGVRPGESQERILSRLERALGDVSPEAPAMAPIFGPVLGLEFPDNETTGLLPTPARKEALHGLLIGLIGALSGTQPLLVVIEDAQWLDSLTKDFLSGFVGLATQMPVIVVVAERTDGDPADAVSGPVHVVALNRLDDANMGRLVDLKLSELFGHIGTRPDRLVAQVLERADGNPLFCEELLRDLQERDLDPTASDANLASYLPESVQRLVLGRLDRLPPFEQSILRFSSTLGMRTPHAWLAGSNPPMVASPEFAPSIEHLVAAAILDEEMAPENPTYIFENATLRDVTYESLTVATRRGFHATIADYLRTVENPPTELLVHHYRLADRPEDELRYLTIAGEQALRVGAFEDARNHMTRGLAILREMPESPETAAIELGIQLGLGAALIPLEGHQSRAAADCYERANALTQLAAPGPNTGRAMFGLWTHYLFSGDIVKALEMAQGVLLGAQMSGEQEAIMQSHLAVSLTEFWHGHLHETVEHAWECVSRYDPQEAGGYVARYSQNPRITAMTDAAWATWMMGDADEAIRLADETLAHAEELGHPWMRTIAMQIHPVTYAHIGDVDKAAASGGAFFQQAEEMGNPVYIGLATIILGWVAGAKGEADQGLGMLLGVRGGMRDQGVRILDPLVTTFALDVCQRAGRHEQGLQLFEEYVSETDIDQHRLYLGEQLRLKAELVKAADPNADVSDLLDQSEVLAREFDAMSYVLRTQLTRRSFSVPETQSDLDLGMRETLNRLKGSANTPDVIRAWGILDGRADHDGATAGRP